MEDRIAKLITKVIMIPLFFFALYVMAFVIGIQIVGNWETKDNSIGIFVGTVIFTNIMAFLITYGIYSVFNRFLNQTIFRRWYHYTHLLFIYISGVASAVISIESLLLNYKIIDSAIDDNTKLITIVFVIIVSNYTFFNAIILNDDFKMKKTN